MSRSLRRAFPSAVETWVFDLDNTLYPASCNLFAQVDQRIGAFIMQRLALEEEAALRLQKEYFRTYGTSLRGLMLNHGVDPVAYLDYVHAIDVTPVDPCPQLDQILERLDGRKIIYTNGSTRHARNIIERLGIARHFNDIFDIVAADYVPKPDPAPYQVMLRRHGVEPRGAVMVEDIAKNLIPAAALGMTTVWVRPTADTAAEDHEDHIHYVTDDLVTWLESCLKPVESG